MTDDNQARQQSLRSALELPMIDLLSFPENERGAVGQVSNNLSKLVMIAESFLDALDLFVQSLGWKHQVGQASEDSRQSGDYANVDALSNSTRRLIGWMSIAARHGAMLAYTAAQIRQKNAGEIKASPTLDALVDKSLVKASGKTFEAAFPAIYKVRLSAAHPHELGTTAKDYDLHSLKDGLQTDYASIETGTVFVEGMIEVNGYSLKYLSSIEGKYVQYTLSPQTFNQLVSSIQTYLAAFKNADYSLMRASGIR